MKNIFVGNLAFAASEGSLRSLFEQYGNVERVNVVTDRETGRSRGFAFVEMSDSEEADRAINALNGMDLDGRTLNVNEARPKPEGGSRGGFGGGEPPAAAAVASRGSAVSPAGSTRRRRRCR